MKSISMQIEGYMYIKNKFDSQTNAKTILSIYIKIPNSNIALIATATNTEVVISLKFFAADLSCFCMLLLSICLKLFFNFDHLMRPKYTL